MPRSLDELQSIAKHMRREIVQMIGAAKSGHPGGSLSAVEILVELYFDHMRIDPKNPQVAGSRPLHPFQGPCRAGALRRDGRGRLRRYAARPAEHAAEAGLDLPGPPRCPLHPQPGSFHRIAGRGSFAGAGHGHRGASGRQPLAHLRACWATAKSRKARSGKPPWPAGSTSWITWSPSWTTTASSSMASSRTSWTSRRWPTSGAPSAGTPSKSTATIFRPFARRFDEAAATKGKPTCIVAHTIKGKGVSFMENNPKFHGTAPTPAEVELALQELHNARAKPNSN